MSQAHSPGIIETLKRAWDDLTQDTAEIRLHTDKQSYGPGETINGTAELIVYRQITTRCLMMKWKGFEKTQTHHSETYRNPISRRRHTRTIYVDDKRLFFNTKMILHSFGNAACVINAGTYTYPFQVTLPNELPGSFVHNKIIVAGIIYELKVWADISCGRMFKREYVQVNQTCKDVSHIVHEKSFKKFLFGGSGELVMEVTLNKNIFAPGEEIVISCNIVNDSQKTVDQLKVKLHRDVVIKAQQTQEEETTEICRLEYPQKIVAKSSYQGEIFFQIPSDLVPSCRGSLVSNQYHLDVECDVPLAFDLEVHPKIIIAVPSGANKIPDLYKGYSKGSWRKNDPMAEQQVETQNDDYY
ncbi:hypothetical protein AKO1_014209 [Acrasis kona]|uniref:Arrestin C-terminal-like domain-containing protein n=1 Tax=Acrasis kona TaxID=1008807 RepID=A0AAW2Z0L4_9EUKA